MSAPTVGAFLERALRERGYAETPVNRTKYAGCAGHPNGAAWCATFVACMARSTGLVLPSYSSYTPTMADGFKADRHWISHVEDFQPGDVVFFYWPEMGRIAHVGLVLRNRGNGAIDTLEGNTDRAGGRTGGQVMLKVRRANMRGAGRPQYAKPARRGPETPVVMMGSPRVNAIKEIQRAFGATQTGSFGPGLRDVVIGFQRKHGLEPDGVVGPGTWPILRQVYAHRVGRR